MPDLPRGTAWAYGAHNPIALADAAPMHPPAPRGICGLDGCVFLAGHSGRDHSWAHLLGQEPHSSRGTEK